MRTLPPISSGPYSRTSCGPETQTTWTGRQLSPVNK